MDADAADLLRAQEHGSQLVVYQKPLKFLGGNGGATLYTFDFLTASWGSVCVSGYEAAELVAIGMHQGTVSSTRLSLPSLQQPPHKLLL